MPESRWRYVYMESVVMSWKEAIITIAIFSTLLLMMLVTVARAEEPSMQDTVTIKSIPQWIMANNPPCKEENKQYQYYSKLATDGNDCWRYRRWICDGKEGIDVEHLPLNFCKRAK
jgi:hypothetical protein